MLVLLYMESDIMILLFDHNLGGVGVESSKDTQNHGKSFSELLWESLLIWKMCHMSKGCDSSDCGKEGSLMTREPWPKRHR